MAPKQASTTSPTTVYYNSACPVCDAAVHIQQRRMPPQNVEWVDVHRNPSAVRSLGVPLEAVRERLHVVSHGRLLAGADAVAELLRGAQAAPEARNARPAWVRRWLQGGASWAYDHFARALYRWNVRHGHWSPQTPDALPNRDPAELARFAALAERWWDQNSEFKPLHRMNPVRLAWIHALAPLRGQRALDVGCGGGILAESMAMQGARVTGIDLAEAPLAVARLHAARSGAAVDYRACSAEALACQEPQAYDVVTCMEMLEHVPRPEEVIAACARLVRPGGWVFFSTINRSLASWLLAIVGAEYVLRMLPRGTHRWDRFVRPAELLAAAQAHGLVLRAQRGLAYNPFTGRFRLYGYLGVGYLLAMQRPPLQAKAPDGETVRPRRHTRA